MVDKKNAYVIYEWPQSKCPSCQDGPITKRNLKPDTELTPLMDLFQGLLDDLEEAGKIFVLFCLKKIIIMFHTVFLAYVHSRGLFRIFDSIGI